MHRDFQLGVEDSHHLDSLGLAWDTIRDCNQGNGVIIRKLPVPTGYNIETVDVLLRLDPSYPDTQIDMAYFHPWLEKKNGKSILASESRQDFDSITWQRWSRHRSGTNSWRPGIDNIGTHLEQVKHWLEKELTRP